MKMKWQLCLLIALFGFNGWAQVSLNKQKLDFESALHSRLSQAIMRVIPESDFTLNVVVELKPIQFQKAKVSTPPKSRLCSRRY